MEHKSPRYQSQMDCHQSGVSFVIPYKSPTTFLSLWVSNRTPPGQLPLPLL